jgi:flagellar biosynthesis protein FlhF
MGQNDTKPGQPPAFNQQQQQVDPQPIMEITAHVNKGKKKSFHEHINFEAHDLRLRFSSFLKRQYSASKEFDKDRDKKNTRGKRSQRPGRPNPEQVAAWRKKIVSKLEIKPLSVGLNDSPTVIAMVGPTGVGKTTTSAKIAAWYSIHENRKVALISMDCYRIGATDQLRTYGRIMRLPCEIVLRKKDLAAAIARHQDKDLIIIDTAGKSPYAPNHVRELGDWFHTATNIEPLLVLSATYKKEDLHHIMKIYNPISPAGLVLTKLDETRAYAALCQQVATTDLPISCLCTGQRVPEDFLLASKDFLRTLFGEGWQAASIDLESHAQGNWA